MKYNWVLIALLLGIIEQGLALEAFLEQYVQIVTTKMNMEINNKYVIPDTEPTVMPSIGEPIQIMIMSIEKARLIKNAKA